MNLNLLEYKETSTERLEAYLNRYSDLDKRIEAFKDQRFYSLEVELTNRCNRECNYCYNSSCFASRQPDLPFEIVQKNLMDAYRYGMKSIAWLGGEPTLYPEIDKVLAVSKSFGFENILFTNGSLLAPELWERIGPTVDRIMLHLDTIDEETFIKLNRISVEESRRIFDQTLKNIDNILNCGFDPDKISLYMVLSRPTFKTIDRSLSWAISEKGFGTTMLYPMVRAGRGKNVDPDTSLNVQEIKEAFEIRAQIEGRPELLLLGPSEYCKHYQLTMAYVRVDGQVTPYAGMPGGDGNVFEEPLSSILERNYKELSFQDLVGPDGTNRLEGMCGVCSNSEFCFGTRTSALNEAGSECLSDPFCW
ncbi:MAG: radical SAM protein [Thermodesulfobacteriota bacterium]